jgi:hypothetical protein
VFQLLDDELDAYVADRDSFRDLLTTRHAEWRELFEPEPPFIIADAEVPVLRRWERHTDGRTDHAAAGTVLAGDAGSPCVVSVTDGTRTIPDGALVEVDGTTGTVTILEAPGSRADR